MPTNTVKPLYTYSRQSGQTDYPVNTEILLLELASCYNSMGLIMFLVEISRDMISQLAEIKEIIRRQRFDPGTPPIRTLAE